MPNSSETKITKNSNTRVFVSSVKITTCTLFRIEKDLDVDVDNAYAYDRDSYDYDSNSD